MKKVKCNLKNPNEFILKSDHAILRIHSDAHGTMDCKIDLDSVEDLKQWNWGVLKRSSKDQPYVLRTVKQCEQPLYNKRQVMLHQYLLWSELQANPGKTCDHINRKTLDNRLSNLRIASPSEQSINQQLRCDNASGFRGVHYKQSRKKFAVQISRSNNNLYLGLFQSKELAASVYNFAASLLHKESAQLNETTATLSDAQKATITAKIKRFL